MADPQAQLQPAEGNLVGAALIGIGAWLVAGAVLLARRDELAARDASWWAWTALAGVLVGLVQLALYVARARRHRTRLAGAEPPS